MTFCLSVLLLTVLVGFAVDFARASGARASLQDTLDAATLRAARVQGDDEAVVKTGKAFVAMKAKDDKRLVGPSARFEVDANSVTSTATATVAPIFLELPLRGPVTVRAHTRVMRAVNTTLELALVLDTTGSMSGAKLATLKTASKNLVATLADQKGAKINIAVVPFAQYVNVGVSRRNQSWLNVANDWTETIPRSCAKVTSRTTCQTQTYTCTRTNDGVPYETTCSRSINCRTTPVSPAQTICNGPWTRSHRFSGCVGSPAYPGNVNDNDPFRVYPGYLDLGCGRELTPLTGNASTVTGAINALSATGETYIPAGLAWGFNVLSSAPPMTEAQPYDTAGPNKKPRKVMVLMTDGENTKLMNAATGRHDVSPAAGKKAKQANDYTAELCRNIKARKIELFTVAFEIDDGGAKDMLRACATDGNHYFEAADAGALLAAFASVASALQTLYISQ